MAWLRRSATVRELCGSPAHTFTAPGSSCGAKEPQNEFAATGSHWLAAPEYRLTACSCCRRRHCCRRMILLLRLFTLLCRMLHSSIATSEPAPSTQLPLRCAGPATCAPPCRLPPAFLSPLPLPQHPTAAPPHNHATHPARSGCGWRG